MKNIIAELASGKIIVSDGAWGTMLQSMGLASGECPEYWNIIHPEKVSEVARLYIEAGSTMILTNTFGGSSFKLANYNLHNKTAEINRWGVRLSKEMAGDKIHVSASVGPTGKFLKPLGNVSKLEMFDAFCEQIIAQAEGGADSILIETMSDLDEAKIAISAAKATTVLPVMVTMTFEKGKQGYRTMMGVSIQQAVEVLSEAGANILGTNCGNGIEQTCEIIAEMRKITSKFLIAHPNAGLPKLKGGKTVFDQTPEDMVDYVPGLILAGANIIGGCCGTNPAHIHAISEKVKQIRLRGN